MYSNKLVACVKANNKVLRESGEKIYLPFGSQYTLFFKNENNRKVEINVSIDGQDVLFGKSLLLDAGKSMDLEGFVRDANGGEDNRAFKFITKTQEISDFRGDKPEDGLVKITYRFEKEKHYTQTPYQTFGFNERTLRNTFTSNQVNSTNLGFDSNTMNISCSVNTSFNNSKSLSTFCDEPGITVEGSATHQAFKHGYIGVKEDIEYTMIFQLNGLSAEEQIQEPITVDIKKQCSSCGKKYKNSYAYCPQDGTYLR